MRVLYVTEYYSDNPQGGGERSAFKLIEAIKKKGVIAKVITSKKKYKVKDLRRFIYFPIYSLIEVMKHGRHYDVIHCLNSTSIYTILAKPFIKKPFIIHVNSYANLCPKGTLIYKDQTDRTECDKDCTLKTCFSCCKDSQWVGISEIKITKPMTFLLWLRYKYHLFLMKRFDGIISVSNVTKKVCEMKGLKNITTVYYGAD